MELLKQGRPPSQSRGVSLGSDHADHDRGPHGGTERRERPREKRRPRSQAPPRGRSACDCRSSRCAARSPAGRASRNLDLDRAIGGRPPRPPFRARPAGRRLAEAVWLSAAGAPAPRTQSQLATSRHRAQLPGPHVTTSSQSRHATWCRPPWRGFSVWTSCRRRRCAPPYVIGGRPSQTRHHRAPAERMLGPSAATALDG